MNTVRPATESDLPAIKQIANRYKLELGYVMYPALRESIARGGLHVAIDTDGTIIGFVNWRKRRDGVTVIYEIAALRRHQGVGKALLSTTSGTVRLKCTVDNHAANTFYERQGFAHIGTETGRKRELNVWQRCT